MNTPSLVANSQILGTFSTVVANSSTRAGDWVSMAGYHHCTVIAIVTDNADVQNFSLNQATSVTGAGSKTLGITEYWHKTDTTSFTSMTVFSRVTQAVAATFASVGGSAAILVAEVPVEKMDVSGGFDCLACNQELATGGTAAVTDVIYILSGPRHARELNVSAIT